MFNFLDGPQASSIEAPELGTGARLVVEVPHWTTVLAIVDNALQPAEGLSKLEPLTDGREGAFATIDLAAGAYNVEAKLGGNTQSVWVVASEGHETRLPMDMWDGLELSTSMPLASAIDGTPADDPLVVTAHELSQDAVAGPAPAGATATETRLFLFGRLAGASAATQTSWDVQLLDESGAAIARLIDQPPRVEDAFWSCTFDLPRGYYVLRAREISQLRADAQSSGTSSEKSFFRCQPLYLCAGWENHIFLECDQSPRLATMSFNMARMGSGFRPDEDATIASACVLAALGNDDAYETIVGATKMEELLRGEIDNPWLGVLAAYALSSREDPGESASLLAEVKDFLLRELSDSPDVRALTLDAERLVQLDYPPMLRKGLHLARAFSAFSADSAFRSDSAVSAIVADSALAKVGQRFAADSAWTAWIEPDETSGPQPAGDSAPNEAAPMQVLTQAFSSSAPIYPLTGAEGTSGTRTTKSFAEQVAIIQEAENVLSGFEGNVVDTVTLPSGGSVEDLLKTNAARISEVVGGDQHTVEEGLRALSGSLEQIENLDRDSSRAMQSVLAAIFNVKRCAAAAGADGAEAEPCASFFTPIEDHVDTLRQEARRLRGLSARKDPPTPEELAQADSFAAKLDELAERLTNQAHLAIVADEDGRLLYGNRLLRDRLQDRLDPQDVLERLHRGLSGSSANYFELPARELSPSSPEGQKGTMVAIHRTVVRGENNEVKANIYLLRNSHARNLGLEAAESLERLLPVLTLHAATAQHGEAGVSPSLQALKDVIAELDKVID